ncbi:hypothetical protein, partial [Micromonospora sp. LOL_021]|uniref:hypothetical protein n=1 Tax=Micromonospora sp. LOL_021 TaxID=3345417 RepID=UPI003A87B6AA
MKRHRTDGVSLTFGLIFILIAGWWLIAQSVDVPLPRVGWIVAGGLILLGVLGLVGALRSGRGEPPAGAAGQAHGPADAGAPTPDEPAPDAPTPDEP